jgi:uncharacterized protein
MNTTATPPAFHIMTKPIGALCNLNCEYCFYLSRMALYEGERFRMSDEVLDSYLRQLIDAHRVAEVTVAWQGGEPTLMGLDFYRRAVDLEERYRKPGQRIQNTIQTNGTLLTDEWCAFFRENGFLVGVSLDGPAEMHDAYRFDKRRQPTAERVIAGIRLLQQHEVDYNILATVNAANADHPLDVYRYLRDEIGATFIQFIPIVEREGDGVAVSERSVTAEQWGRFLNTVFDEWVRRDVGTVYVQMFDAALAAWVGVPSGLCMFSETCGYALALERNGDLYSCDHFVDREHLLGNIQKERMPDLVASEKQRAFGRAKHDALPEECWQCPVRFACHGECPKNRFLPAADGSSNRNYLCAGYKAFFTHIDAPMRYMAAELRANRAPANVMAHLARKEATPAVPAVR